MNMQALYHPHQPLDIIVGGKGNQVVVELDVHHNDRVNIGDRYVVRSDDHLTILRVTEIEYPDDYNNFTARRTRAMREGIVGLPDSRPAREALQRKLVTMTIEGEIHTGGRRTVGTNRLPERLSPVEPITDDMLAWFTAAADGNLQLGLLKAGRRVLPRAANLQHNLAGDRLVVLGMPGKGKSQLVRGLLAQAMAAPQPEQPVGVLVLDRAGEYIEDGLSQDGHTIYGLQNHPQASQRLVIVSNRRRFHAWAEQERIAACLRPRFSLTDIDPIDLADFYGQFTATQRALLKDYAHDPHLYRKLLRESKLGQIDKSHWFKEFPGLFEISKQGKQLFKMYESVAEEGDDLQDWQIEELEQFLTGQKPKVLARIIHSLKRFALNPFFGGQSRGRDILAAKSCVPEVLKHLAQGQTVVIDLRGVDDDNYLLIAALFARRLMSENKASDDPAQRRVGLVMEEAHNILSEAELRKGSGQGSVFVELAREGRKLKLGFILVTQQPDARSIAPEIAATLDTVVAFAMPPENTSYLSRLKPIFKTMEYTLANARPFDGVAVVAGQVLEFRTGPVLPDYMQACTDQRLADFLTEQLGPVEAAVPECAVRAPCLTAENRLSRLLQERNQAFHREMTATLQAWQEMPGE